MPPHGACAAAEDGDLPWLQGRSCERSLEGRVPRRCLIALTGGLGSPHPATVLTSVTGGCRETMSPSQREIIHAHNRSLFCPGQPLRVEHFDSAGPGSAKS